MKKILLGVIIGMLVSLPIYVFADVTSMIGKKVETEVPVKLDGKYLDAKAIAIQGTSYLPVRSLSEAIGYNVQYDGEKREIIVSSPIEPTNPTEPTNPANPDTSVEEWQNSLEYITSQIKMIEGEIFIYKMTISTETDPTRLAELNQKVRELEEELARFKAKKEELEKNSNP
jgi:hypothetical protein